MNAKTKEDLLGALCSFLSGPFVATVPLWLWDILMSNGYADLEEFKLALWAICIVGGISLWIVAIFFTKKHWSEIRENIKSGGISNTEITKFFIKAVAAAVAVAVFMVIVLSVVAGPGNGSNSGSYHSVAECSWCGRSFKSGDSGGNFMSIAKTTMCKNCYNNYKWANNALGN